MLAPFTTHIPLPQNPAVSYSLRALALVLLTMQTVPSMFSSMLTFIITVVFFREFRDLHECFRKSVDVRGQFHGDFEKIRQRHQTLSRAVECADKFLMCNNVGAFCTQIVGIIISLYALIFYPGIVSVSSFPYWLTANCVGLGKNCIEGIAVNHMVGNILTVCRLCVFLNYCVCH